MSFISDQASYGQPAEYTPRNQELEGEYGALKGILPKKAHYFADQIGRISGEYLTPDQPFYNQFKGEVKSKSNDFQKRLNSGEDVGSIINDMSNYRNQVSGTLDAFKKRKDMFESWNSALEKNDKIDSNTKTALRNLALDNISNSTTKKGLTLDLPLPSPAIPVNYDEKAAKLTDEMVEKEGHDTYGSQWSQLKADPTKYANFKSGFIHKDPQKIKQAVMSGLINDPEVQSSLDQDAELQLHSLYKNTQDPFQRQQIQQNIEQLHHTIKQNKLEDASNMVSWTKEGPMKTLDRTIIDNTEASEKAKKEPVNPNVPVYEAPQTPIKGTDYGDAFSLKKKGDQIPLTEKEKQSIGLMGAFPLINVKSHMKDSYDQPNTMDEKSKNFLIGASKYIDPKLHEKIKEGKSLTFKEQSTLYPEVAKMAENAKKDIEVNSRVVGMTEKESDNTNRELFGKEKAFTVENLGTGLSINTKFYDKETGELKTLADIKQEHDSKSEVSIQGKFTGENPYVIASGGDKSFAAPKQLSIDGKEYVISGPKAYIDSKTQSTDNEDNSLLKRTQKINEIYSAKLSTLPVDMKSPKGEDIKVYFEKDKTNPTEGIYKMNYKGNVIQSSSATKLEDYINTEESK